MNDESKTETLRGECERILSESKAVAYAVAVHDYETGLRLSINADRRFHAASTMKVAILLAIGKAIDEGRIRPNDTLHVRNRFRSAIDRAPFRIDAELDGYPELHKSIGRTATVSRSSGATASSLSTPTFSSTTPKRQSVGCGR